MDPWNGSLLSRRSLPLRHGTASRHSHRGRRWSQENDDGMDGRIQKRERALSIKNNSGSARWTYSEVYCRQLDGSGGLASENWKRSRDPHSPYSRRSRDAPGTSSGKNRRGTETKRTLPSDGLHTSWDGTHILRRGRMSTAAYGLYAQQNAEQSEIRYFSYSTTL